MPLCRYSDDSKDPLKRISHFFASFINVVGQSQFSCVSDCGSSSTEIGVFPSILECCANGSAGGFVQGGICSPCLPFRGIVQVSVVLQYQHTDSYWHY